jgi:hypothetical protein
MKKWEDLILSVQPSSFPYCTLRNKPLLKLFHIFCTCQGKDKPLDRGNMLCSQILWNKENLLQQWKVYMIVPMGIYRKWQ